jgi:hypothetical protein
MHPAPFARDVSPGTSNGTAALTATPSLTSTAALNTLTGITDAPGCSTIVESSLDPIPTPTPALSSAMATYYAQFTLTGVPSTNTNALCGVTTALPSSLLPAYSSYGSSASSWVVAHSSQLTYELQNCPNQLAQLPATEQENLGLGLVFAYCYGVKSGANPVAQQVGLGLYGMVLVSLLSIAFCL